MLPAKFNFDSCVAVFNPYRIFWASIWGALRFLDSSRYRDSRCFSGKNDQILWENFLFLVPPVLE
jgi:hypothetical protein